jgi:hypothetical protein
MLGRSKPGYPPLSPLGGGATSWVVRDFLEASSRGRFQVWRLEGDDEANDVMDFDEFLEYYRCSADVDEDSEFEDFIEHLDNQQW